MRLYSYSSSFTRPNNVLPYSSNTLVANNTGLGSIVPMSFSPTQGFLLTAVKIKLTGSSSNTNASFTLHLFQFSPTVNNGDGGTFAPTSEFGYLGNVFVDCTQFPICGLDVVGIAPVDPNLIPIFTDTTQGTSLGKIYGLLRAESSYVPTANEVITITLIGVD